jgi:hypothetical protein
MAIRTGRGYGKIHHPYQELYEGVRPSIQGLRAAKYLPIAMLDKLHDDDPIVLLPGTWVGRLASTSTNLSATNTFTTAEVAARAVVPACVGSYTVLYGTNDTDFGTYDIDSAANDAVASAVAGTIATKAVKPFGVITAPVYSEVLKTKYTNYSRDLMPSVLMGNYTVVIPAITNNEKLIEPGDLVRVDGVAGTTGSWEAASSATGSNVPGRLVAYDASSLAGLDYVVGRCIDKYIVARGTPSAKMSADAATFSALNTDHQFNTLKKVQTVPGLGLSGSGTQGIPAMFEHAVADSAGDYFALVIKVDL